jgi:hypothetical protein
MLHTIAVIIGPHSDRSGREKRKNPGPPTALMRRRAMAANHSFRHADHRSTGMT